MSFFRPTDATKSLRAFSFSLFESCRLASFCEALSTKEAASSKLRWGSVNSRDGEAAKAKEVQCRGVPSIPFSQKVSVVSSFTQKTKLYLSAHHFELAPTAKKLAKKGKKYTGCRP